MEDLMNYTCTGNDIMLRVDRGEKVMESIGKVAEKENIKAGFVSGIGAVDQAELSYFEVEKDGYNTVNFEEDFEVLSLNGTLSYVDNKPHQHVHMILGREDFSTIGGHLQEATVSITLEVHITVLDTEVNRKPDDKYTIQTLDI